MTSAVSPFAPSSNLSRSGSPAPGLRKKAGFRLRCNQCQKVAPMSIARKSPSSAGIAHVFLRSTHVLAGASRASQRRRTYSELHDKPLLLRPRWSRSDKVGTSRSVPELNHGTVPIRFSVSELILARFLIARADAPGCILVLGRAALAREAPASSSARQKGFQFASIWTPQPST